MKLGLEGLKLLHGLHDLGFYQVPATYASKSAGIHNYLTTLINPSASSDSENISSIMSRLSIDEPSSLPQPEVGSVHFLTLTVCSNGSDEPFSGGSVPAWKWFIPADLPHLMARSVWKPDLEQLLEFPEWSSQGKRHLLLQGVSEERAEELRHSMVLFPASTENVVSFENSENVD